MRRPARCLLTASVLAALLGAGSTAAVAVESTPPGPGSSGTIAPATTTTTTPLLTEQPPDTEVPETGAPGDDVEVGSDVDDETEPGNAPATDPETTDKVQTDTGPVDIAGGATQPPQTGGGIADQPPAVAAIPEARLIVWSSRPAARPVCADSGCEAIPFARPAAILPMITTAAANLQVPVPTTIPPQEPSIAETESADPALLVVTAALLVAAAAAAFITVRRVRARV